MRKYSRRYNPYKKGNYGKFKFSGSGTVPRNINVTNANRNIARDTRMVEYSTINLPNAGDATFGQAFKLDDLPGYTDYNLYDQYRINAIKIEFMTNYGNTTYIDGAITNDANQPFLYTALDYDDAAAPANKNVVLQRSTARFHGRIAQKTKVVRWLKPCVAQNFFQTALTTGYGARSAPWLDVKNAPSVPHYGLKGCVTSLSNNIGNDSKLVIVATFYLEFKFSS